MDKKINILIDISRVLEEKKTGIGLYQKYIFEELLKKSEGSDINILPVYYGFPIQTVSFADIQKELISFITKYPVEPFMIKRLHDRFFVSPKIKKIKNFMYHSTAYVGISGIEKNTIMTIHDLIFMQDKRHYNKSYAEMISYYLKKVKKIIAISNSTKNDLLEMFPKIKEKNIEVVYQGVGDNFYRISDSSEKDVYRDRLTNGKKYILFLGAFTYRKNIINIVKAFKLLVTNNKIKPEYMLVLAGKPLDVYQEVVALVKELELKDRVMVRDYVKDEEVNLLLNSADLFVFPSFSEGFGLPVIEAMKCGIPCIVSDRHSLKELFSDVAVPVDPYKVMEIADAIVNTLQDGALYSKLIDLGIEKAKMFTWKNTAEKMMKIYRELV